MPMQVDAENEPVRSNRKIWFPFVTFAIFLVNCSIYFYGIFYIIKWRNAEVSLFSPISPPITSWYFYTVTDWPSCQDTRYQYRRMFTLQFIHSGLFHLLGNNIVLLGYGAILEYHHPFGHTILLLTYEMGVVLGSLGHSYLFPYRGLIGCSPGVYAVMGGCVAMLIASGKHMDKGLQSILLLILLAQFFLDILAYFFLYMPNVGYAAHAYGYFTGFCTVMGFAVFYREAVWIKVLGIFAIGGLAYEISFLFHHFYNVWPPEPYEEDLFRNVDDFDCCRALFENADDDYALNKCYQ